MENILYNELKARGFNIDVGVVPVRRKEADGKIKASNLEVDFVLNKGEKRYYIQSALTVADEAKRLQEVNSLNRINDTFAKIVVIKDERLPWVDERGVQYISIEDFLLRKIDEL